MGASRPSPVWGKERGGKRGQFLILFTPRPAPSPVQEMVRITACAHRLTFGDSPTVIGVSHRDTLASIT